MPYQFIRVEPRDRFALITLDRPKVNALSADLLRELREALAKLEAQPEIGCVLITGAGESFFSAGADLQTAKTAFTEPDRSDGLTHEGLLTMNALETYRKPIVAVVNGVALGGGTELCLACHVRIASEKARFGLPEVNIGIIPGWGGTHRLPRMIGESRALEWMLTGRLVSAEEAFVSGLVCKVAPSDQLMSAAEELAKHLSGRPPLAVAAILEAVHTHALSPHLALKTEADAFARVSGSHDALEGITAFLEKRPPNFTGR